MRLMGSRFPFPVSRFPWEWTDSEDGELLRAAEGGPGERVARAPRHHTWYGKRTAAGS